jgi:hypothetical protein
MIRMSIILVFTDGGGTILVKVWFKGIGEVFNFRGFGNLWSKVIGDGNLEGSGKS